MRVPASQIASISAMPLAVSMIGTMSTVPTSRPRSRSNWVTSQSIVRKSLALSSFGNTIPSTPDTTAACTSP